MNCIFFLVFRTNSVAVIWRRCVRFGEKNSESKWNKRRSDRFPECHWFKWKFSWQIIKLPVVKVSYVITIRLQVNHVTISMYSAYLNQCWHLVLVMGYRFIWSLPWVHYVLNVLSGRCGLLKALYAVSCLALIRLISLKGHGPILVFRTSCSGNKGCLCHCMVCPTLLASGT